jgi:asparagine synthase (glutamine-hydrolysing)
MSAASAEGPAHGRAIVHVRRHGESSRQTASRCGQTFAEGPLTLEWDAGPHRDFHASEETVCLVEGSLYSIGDRPPGPGHGTRPARHLVDAYERCGESVFERVRGEYWAVLWRREARTGVLVTDQMGTRTPYFHSVGAELLAASDVRDLLAVLPSHPGPDPLGLVHWLMLTEYPGEGTMLAGISRLPAAHLLPIGQAGPARRYWTPVYQPPIRAGTDELAARLREILGVAVRRRLARDAPTGVRLSGGLDSSAVAALASREGADLHAYSAVFPEHPTIDESRLVELTARRLGLRSTTFSIRTGSVVDGTLSYLEDWRLPPSSPNMFFWGSLFERASADGVRIMLDGEGGDELFGFSPYLLADFVRHGRIRAALALTRRWPTGFPATRGRISYRFTQFGVKGAMPALAHRLRRRLRGADPYLPPWIPSELGAAWLDTELSPFEWKSLRGPRWWAFLVGAVTRGPGPALVYEQTRRMAARTGLEASHPLVDPDVIEFMLQIPPLVAYDLRFNRPLLRESLAGMLPDEVRLRTTKSTFDALFHGILAGRELPIVRRLLDPASAQIGEYVDLPAVWSELLRTDPPSEYPARQTWALHVWRLLTAELWLRSHSDSSFPARFRETESLAPVDLDVTVRRPDAPPE